MTTDENATGGTVQSAWRAEDVEAALRNVSMLRTMISDIRVLQLAYADELLVEIAQTLGRLRDRG